MAFVSCFHLRLLFLCLALFMAAECRPDELNKKVDSDETISDDDVSARVQPNGGKIMIVRDNDYDASDDNDNDDDDNNDNDNDNDDDNDVDRDNDDDDDDFDDSNDDMLSFELDSIEEKDSDGNDVGSTEGHSVESFEDRPFSLSSVDRNSNALGVAAINVNLSTKLEDSNADVDIMLYLFREDGTISFGNETFDVQAGTVKFNIKISNWDFCDGSAQDCSEGKAGEYLDVNIKFKSKDTPIEVTDEERKSQNKPAVCKDKDTPDTDSDPDDSSDNANDGDDDDDDDCPHIYNMGGDSEMLLNRGVMNGDTYAAMPFGFPKVEIEDGEKKIKFRVPKFDDNVIIDPSVTPGRVPKNASPSPSLCLKIHILFIAILQAVTLFINS